MPISPIGISPTQRGYTLLELLVVLLLVGFLFATLSLVPTQWTRTAQLRASGIGLLTDITSAKTNALTRSVISSVTVLQDGNGYQIQPSGAITVLPKGMTISFAPSDFAPARPELGRVTFYPDGVAEGGTFVLNYGPISRMLRVAWPSGTIIDQSE